MKNSTSSKNDKTVIPIKRDKSPPTSETKDENEKAGTSEMASTFRLSKNTFT